MHRGRLTRRIALLACATLFSTMVPLAAGHTATTWTKVAENGVSNTGDILPVPGAQFKNKLILGNLGSDGAKKVSVYAYDLTFRQVYTDGFGSDNYGMYPTVSFGGSLFIGTRNDVGGGELWKWDGLSDPVTITTVPWTRNNSNYEVIPLSVFNNELYVSVTNNSGCLLFKFNGTTWTQVVGQGAAATTTGPGFGNTNNGAILSSESMVFGGRLILPVMNAVDGLHVYSYDGTSVALIGMPTSGLWEATQQRALTAVSLVDNRLYMGTGSVASQPLSHGELWIYDGTTWSKATLSGGGIDDANNTMFVPLARGADLYVSSWNSSEGGKVYKRSGAGFNAISDPGIGNAANHTAMVTSYNGGLFAEVGNAAGCQVFRTPIAPSIDRVVPDSGPYGTMIRLEGHDFGTEQGSGQVTFNGKKAGEYVSWTDTAIDAVVPPEATTGKVKVTNSGGDSNEVQFTLGLSKTWYFAEGTTRDNSVDGRFDEWICIQNPGTTRADVVLTYMQMDGKNRDQHIAVEPTSRYTVDVNGFLGKDVDASTVVQSDQLVLAERPMYFNYRNKWTGGHDVIGVPAPRSDYYFAEGTTRDNGIDGTFEEWLCLQNPNASDVEVAVEYQLETGITLGRTYHVGARSRRTVDVNLEVGKDHDVSAVVKCPQPIVAERPMYFNYRNKWTGGHDVVGATGPGTTFYFAEGTTRDNATDGAFEEWICLQNAKDQDAHVTITYYTDQRGTLTQDVTVPARTRRTVDVNLALGRDIDTSFKIASDREILAERPMYFNYHNAWDGGHDVMGCSAPAQSFYFAEGTTLSTDTNSFATWLAVMNPGDSEVSVTFSYMMGDGSNKQATATVSPQRRYTREISLDVGANQNVSIKVDAEGGKVVCERPMYFNYQGWCTGGHDTLGYGI